MKGRCLDSKLQYILKILFMKNVIEKAVFFVLWSMFACFIGAFGLEIYFLLDMPLSVEFLHAFIFHLVTIKL